MKLPAPKSEFPLPRHLQISSWIDLDDIYQPCPGLLLIAQSVHFSPVRGMVCFSCVGAVVGFAPGICATACVLVAWVFWGML